MKESLNISNRFSDAYIVAMLDGRNAEEVIRQFEASYPELAEVFRSNAKDLELLYGHIRKNELPSDTEIAKAYSRFKQEAPAASIFPTPPVETFGKRFTKAVSSFFTARPILAGASLSAVLAVLLLAILYRPGNIPTDVTTAEKEVVSSAPNADGSVPEIAEAEKELKNPTDPLAPTFRGEPGASKQDKERLDKKDRERLSKLQSDNSLAAPTGLKVTTNNDSVILTWNPVKNALSYIVEIKRANEDRFVAVSQTSQPQARLYDLPSSERLEIRVVAASGERKGEASAAKIVIVP